MYDLRVSVFRMRCHSLDVITFIVFCFQDALSLPSRPFLHCSTLIPIFTTSLYFVQKLLDFRILRHVHWIFLIAWCSHHLRDALRRGLWLYPWGSTQPLTQSVYLFSILCLPFFVKCCMYAEHVYFNKTNSLHSITV